MSDKVRDLVALVVAVVVPLLAGGLGSIATVSSIPTWYAQLNKPPWNPPDWLFGPVWTLLYILMGVAAWLVWRSGWPAAHVRLAVMTFAVQLVFNVLWSIIFFGLRSPGPALVEIVILWLLVLATTVQFFRLTSLAGYLMLPYLLWVSFASALNASVWSLNR